MSLYGQWKWSPNDKLFVTITEGEIDALTIAQVQGYQYPVVSVPKGAAASAKTLKANLKFIKGHSTSLYKFIGRLRYCITSKAVLTAVIVDYDIVSCSVTPWHGATFFAYWVSHSSPLCVLCGT